MLFIDFLLNKKKKKLKLGLNDLSKKYVIIRCPPNGPFNVKSTFCLCATLLPFSMPLISILQAPLQPKCVQFHHLSHVDWF